MGLFGELFHPHDQKEAAPAAETVETEVPSAPMESGEAVAAAATTGEATESVEPAHMDMAPAAPATVDLSNMPVHPAEMSGDAKKDDEAVTDATPVSIKTEDATNSETDTQEDASEAAGPVAVGGSGEFSTAVSPLPEVNDGVPVVIGGEGKDEEVGGSEQVAAEAAESPDADSSKPEDAAAMLKKFQDELGQETETGGDANGAGDMPVTSVESTDSGSTEAGSGGVSADSAAKKDDLSPEGLMADAADEAAAIEAEIEKAKPEIHAMGGEIPVETADEVEGGAATQPESEATTTEQGPAVTPVEDEPFPTPPVEDDADKSQVDAGVTGDDETEAPEATEIIDPNRPTVVDGADVHINRAKYLEPDESVAEAEATQADGSEVTKTDVLKLPVAERTALEETAADLESRAKAIRDLLEKAA